MSISRPIFWIPRENTRVDSKTGGGQPPKYFGDPAEFSRHKISRIKDINTIFTKANTKAEPILKSPGGELFFEIEFHEKALSKSTQPRKLLEGSNIDIYAQKTSNKFLASTNRKNLHSFRTTIASLSMKSDKNASAYLSAITKIEPISRKDKMVDDVASGAKDFRGFLYLANTLSTDECKNISAQVSSAGNPDTHFFISTAGSKVIYGLFQKKFIDQISQPDPRIPIQRIEKSLDFAFPQGIKTDYSYDEVAVSDPTSEAVVAVVDSGISVAHRHLSRFLLGEEDGIKDASLEDRSHGTFVASRIIFGHNIESQIRTDKALTARARVIDVRVMKKEHGASDVQIISAIHAVLENPQYSNVAVFNLSVNYDDPEEVLTGNKHYFTRELDALANKYGVLFVISAGNHKRSQHTQYPNCLFEDGSCITTPADSMNNLSVGSVADIGSTHSIAREGEPSPFSRSGIPGIIKPDVAHFGGNLNKFHAWDGLGVKGFTVEDSSFTECVGTSFAAPLVSQIAARLYAQLRSTDINKDDACNLTKALIIHSALYNNPTDTRIDRDQARRMVGFGIPDFDRALNCAESSATFIHVGLIGRVAEAKDKEIKESKHRIKIIVPSELEGKGKKIKVSATLVYTPPVSESGEVDYSLVDIELNLHRINKKGKSASAELTKGTHDYRNKWTPLKHFEKTFTAYKGGEWEVWLTLTTRGRLETTKYDQPYALILTVEDATTDPAARVDVYQVIKEQHPSYLAVEIRERIRVRP